MHSLTSIRSAVPIALLAILGSRAPAQIITTQLAFGGGVATDQLGVRSNALSVAPSLSYLANESLSLQLGGNATRFGNGALSFGGGLSLNEQRSLGRYAGLTFSANASASGLTGAATSSFAQGDLLPALELRWRGLALFGGIRAGSGIASERSLQPNLPFPGAGASNTSVSRSGAGPVLGGVASIGTIERSLRIGWREERLRIEDVVRAERSLSASAAFAVTSKASLEVAAGRYDGNRLFGTPSGEYLSAGIAFRFGGASDPALPKATGAPPAPAGTTRLSLLAADARRVEIAGDFNEWKPAAATRTANGVWYADLKIPPGQYRYAFRVNGAEWRVPNGATAVDDGFGGKSAWLTVSEPRSR